MKKKDVPQDNENLFEGKFQEIQYATDENGQYIKAQSPGWSPKNTILKEEWKAVDQEAEKARKSVLAGEKSPLYFHMKFNQMSPKILAGYAGMRTCRVKRLCKPKPFAKIKDKEAEKLSFALKTEKPELKTVPDQPVSSLGGIITNES